MTTYNELAGLKVNYLGSDPTLNSGNEGQVWYNSATGTLKSLVQLKAWSAGSNMGTARRNLAGFGTQTSAVGAGGESSSIIATEIWNGTSWTSNPNGLATGRYSSRGSGTQASGLVSGGSVNPTPVPTAFTGTEEWTGPGVPQTKTITTS